MYVMPINVAQQLGADRRRSYEAVASRRRLRNLASRRVPNPVASPTLLTRRVPATIDLCRDDSCEAVHVRTVA